MKKINYVILGILVLSILVLNLNFLEKGNHEEELKILETNKTINKTIEKEIKKDIPIREINKKTNNEDFEKEEENKKQSYENTIFIDPSIEKAGEGSFESPLKSWEDVLEWKSNFQYLQKRGTIDYLEHELNIEGENLIIGDYGEGNKPIIKSNSGNYENEHAIKLGNAKNVTIKDLEINSGKGVSGIYFLSYGDYQSSENKIINCKIYNASWGIRGIDQDYFKIIGNEIFNIKDDGIFLVGDSNKKLLIEKNKIYDVNENWFINQSEKFSSGDNIQLEGSFKEIYIKENILDHSSTGNKFSFIFNSAEEGKGIIENNHMIHKNHYNLYLSGNYSLTIRDNLFEILEGNYSNFYYSHIQNLTLENNTFIQH